MTAQLQLGALSNSGATFSPCGTYRYRLWRAWGKGPRAVFVCLNPSTADHEINDPTIRRCIDFARRWGYAGLEVVNIFALRSTDPKALYTHPEPIGGVENDLAIAEAAARAGRVIVAWGKHGALRGRGHDVYRMLVDAGIRPLAFKVTTNAQPYHPLYQPADLVPVLFKMGWP